jgi:hypothetical protein
MKTSIIHLIGFALVASFFVGCGNSPDDRGKLNRARNRSADAQIQSNNNGNTGTSTTSQFETFGFSSSAIGEITQSTSTTGDSFQSAIEDLLSSFLEKDQFGEVSGESGAENGVLMMGRFVLPQDKGSQHKAVGNADYSNLTILIFDDLTNKTVTNGDGTQEAVDPIKIGFKKASYVERFQNVYHIEFKDDYGVIMFDGEIRDNVTVGTISFKNYKNVDASERIKKGNLGVYAMPVKDFLFEY